MLNGERMKEYKFFRIKGCLNVLSIIGNFDSLRYTDIEIEYIKKTEEKLSPSTLLKCLKDLERNELISKEKDKYKITSRGREVLMLLERLSHDSL